MAPTKPNFDSAFFSDAESPTPDPLKGIRGIGARVISEDDDLDEPLGTPACNLDGDACESCQ